MPSATNTGNPRTLHTMGIVMRRRAYQVCGVARSVRIRNVSFHVRVKCLY